jgi:glutathione S-transferase
MPPPSYTLYTPAGSFRAFAPLIAAEINHVDVSVETENMETIAHEKSPTGQVPLLERNHSNTSSTAKTASAASQKHKGDVIFTSASIARYIAGLRTDTYLMGSSWLEEASINQWVDWCGAELEVPSCLLFYPIAGFMTLNDPEMYVPFIL